MPLRCGDVSHSLLNNAMGGATQRAGLPRPPLHTTILRLLRLYLRRTLNDIRRAETGKIAKQSRPTSNQRATMNIHNQIITRDRMGQIESKTQSSQTTPI